MRQLIPTIFWLLLSLAANGTVRYVTPAGAGALDGTSWANALASGSLQGAITASGVGDEVWVAVGTYKPGASRLSAFSMKNGVVIYGSFGGSETAVAQRNLSNGLTSILSGEIGSAGIGDNCYHTISNSGLNNTAIIDGFVISDANDNRTSTTTDGLGGGIYNNGSNSGNQCSPTIRNCIIQNNQAVFGGGIFNSGYNGGVANPIILNCVIANNTATAGGGIDNFGLLNGNASPTITNCVIYGNTATQRAGAMYCWGGNNGNANPTVINSVFANNAAIDGGGVVSDRLNASGGSSGNSNPNFKNCIFWANTAIGIGPQFFILGGATFVATYSDISLTAQTSPHVISGAGTGNINSNPAFSNIGLGAGTDGSWLTNDDGLQLASMASPCHNTGNNTNVPATDILFKNRIANGAVDIGAYEFHTAPLPVTLTHFSAKANSHNHTVIRWTTASEHNSSGFDIQRSSNGNTFETIGFVKGAGHSNASLHYSFTDENSLLDNGYYRLRQVDINGRHEYTNAVYIQKPTPDIVVFPNPTTGVINLLGYQFSTAQNLKVVNNLGVVVKFSSNDAKLDISSLPSGVYTLVAETSEGKIYRCIVKQ